MARLRAQRGLTFDRLAEQLGRRRPNVIVYEKGAVAPTPSVLVQLAAALGVQPCELTTARPATAELADLRAWAGLTMVEAAAAAGMPRSTWEKTERGQRPLGRERAEIMGRALDVEPDVVEAAYERARRRYLAATQRGADRRKGGTPTPEPSGRR
jgi:transcriptional regulator with XRE-family HTH domain